MWARARAGTLAIPHQRRPEQIALGGGPRYPTTGHQAFTDIAWLVRQFGADPAAFALGTVEPGEAVSSQRRFLRRFFTYALR